MTDAAPSPATIDEDLGYADALAELNEILDELEDENIDIDVLSSRVERAAELIRHCRGRINLAQERVGSIVDQLEELAASPTAAEPVAGHEATDSSGENS